MGLLSRILSSDFSSDTPQGGLLSRALLYERQPLNFYEWADSYGFSKCGILSPVASSYVLTHALGVDALSVALCLSTDDFIGGIINLEKKEWQTFEGEGLQPFFQLFTDEFTMNVTSLHFLPFDCDGKTYIALVVDSDGKPSVLPEAGNDAFYLLKKVIRTPYPVFNEEAATAACEKGIEQGTGYLYLLSFKLAIDTITGMLSLSNEEIKDKSYKAIMDECFNKAQKLFQSPNSCARGENCEIKTLIYAKDEIDETLLQSHIKKEFSEIFGSFADKIVLLIAGTCPNVKGAVKFLTWG